MKNEAMRQLTENPKAFMVLIKSWPGIAALLGILIGAYGFLASNGWINGTVHVSEFNVVKQRFEEHERMDASERSYLKDNIQDIRDNVKFLVQQQLKQKN